ncbi:ABC-F family ATP-binding cassette domain-containing protein [Thiovibrio frasassiensis]|uniref:Probable ATP-binding protein YbiT n=1 Tax=Thiovibrio frasassiensis TaxID=2984131 RepID=A0A9X4MHN1_9BACT|nr:ABC-F family ATP-binding cassette domain-containing protein [Thiovibrio frasassiensis]MDG4476523.1 ABC-F family ATP-binding cassette domain-containing protein [Thiovibrio frasassiensis]
MLAINQLSIQFGSKQLFKNVSVRVHPGEKIGLVGVNGAGKSTLLKIMAGVKHVDDGILARSKNISVGYLPQEITAFPPGRTLFQEAETAFAEALSLQKELDQVNQDLGRIPPEDPGFADLLHRQGDLQHRLDQSDIFTMESQIERILLGLGFSQSDFSKDSISFSGGWLMRLMLAKILLAKPDLLLLDEPTNHLDIESLTWLEEFLQNHRGAMVMISHDRSFLDNLTTVTWEISLGELTVYKGNYSKYLVDKANRMIIKRAAYENQQAMIDQTMKFVDRFRSKASKATQVQSRLKQLEKIELIELDETENSIAFRFPPSPPSGRTMLEIEGLHKQFGEQPVFNNLSFSLQRGEKLAVLGVNGAGKSTLVKILAGLIPPDSGTIRKGHNVAISYFGQHQAQELDPRFTVLETLSHVNNEMSVTQTRSLLGAFLFRGDDVDKKVAVLSGGEKSRVALAKMIATPANLLILDEPTNHLDIQSQEVLQEAMRQYDGSIIVVSHNRYFANSFVSKVLEIKNSHGTIFDGNIDYYLHKTHAESAAAPPKSAVAPKSKPGAPVQEKQTKKGKESRKLQAEMRQQKNREIGPLKKNVERYEQEIDQLEPRKSQLEQAMADPELYKDQDRFAELNNEYTALGRKLKKTYADWEQDQAKIEAIEARFAEECEE